jgi:hypothetical protein
MLDDRARKPLWGTVAACLAGLALWFVLRGCDSGPEVELEAPGTAMESVEPETTPRRRETSEPVLEDERPVLEAPKIRFVVEDEGGNPLAGARLVSIESRPWRRASHRVKDELGLTDESGAFSLPRAEVEALYADQLWIAVVAQTYRHDFITTLPPENERRVVLEPQDYFEMIFLDPAGNPIPGVAVEMGRMRLIYDRTKLSGELLASPGSQFGTARMRSDENGRVCIPSEGSGWRICHVRHPHYVHAADPPKARTDFAIELPSPPRIFQMAEIYGAAVKLEGGLKFEEESSKHRFSERRRASGIGTRRRAVIRRTLEADRLFLRVGDPRSTVQFKTVDDRGVVVAHDLHYRAISEGIETTLLKPKVEDREKAEPEVHKLRVRFRFRNEPRNDFTLFRVASSWLENDGVSMTFLEREKAMNREERFVLSSEIENGLPTGRYRIQDASEGADFKPVVVNLNRDREVTIDLLRDFGLLHLTPRVSGHREEVLALTYEWFRSGSEEVALRLNWVASDGTQPSEGFHLLTGDYELRVSGPGVERATRRVHVKPGRNRIELNLLERLTLDDRDVDYIGELK